MGASGFGCIKILECARNHFGSDILRAKSLVSMRWKIGKLLGEPSSRVELQGKFLPKTLSLSVDVVRTSEPLKR